MSGEIATATLFSLALWLAGIGHFCLLAASFQVPARLNWKEDLAKLSSFNRKLMWVYGVFMVFIIISFGTLTLLLHSEMLRGDRSALALAIFIGSFWSIRLIVDFLVYKHSDWPKGFWFVIGHVLLDLLFLAFVVTYLGLAFWHLFMHTAL